MKKEVLELLEIFLIAFVVQIILLLIIIAFSKNIYKQLQVCGAIGSVVVFFLTGYFFYMGRPDFIDIVITYALLNITTVFVVYKFIKTNNLGFPNKEDDDGDI